jgi:hypothetical protein
MVLFLVLTAEERNVFAISEQNKRMKAALVVPASFSTCFCSASQGRLGLSSGSLVAISLSFKWDFCKQASADAAAAVRSAEEASVAAAAQVEVLCLLCAWVGSLMRPLQSRLLRYLLSGWAP